MDQSRSSGDHDRGLRGRRVLIVEDEMLIAQDLAEYFAQLGAEVVGPAMTLDDGFRLSGRAEAAVLDVNLRGEMSFPLAETLLARHVPFVFFTAYAAVAVPAHLRGVERYLKPASYTRVHRSLARRLETPEEGEDDELVRLLPKLRIAACLLVRDPRAADRLVERALERAVATLDLRDRAVPLEDWIVSILCRTADDDDQQSMI
jgi:ActR/RegA family two-component response regulator